jgi:hypothetical protein
MAPRNLARVHGGPRQLALDALLNPSQEFSLKSRQLELAVGVTRWNACLAASFSAAIEPVAHLVADVHNHNHTKEQIAMRRINMLGAVLAASFALRAHDLVSGGAGLVM